jgi:hypothetical protein
MLFGVLVTALGAVGLARPVALISLVERPWQTRAGLLLAVAVRVVLGVALLVAAPDSRFPATLRALGGLSLLAAVALPLVGFERLRRFVQWWAERPSGFVRAWSAAALLFGVFVVVAVR